MQYLLQYSVSLMVAVVSYIFLALGLYTMAKRRGIKNFWLAWIPVVNVWVLGCIADQYRYVNKGQIKARRKVLVVLAILSAVLSVLIVCLALNMYLVEIAPYLPAQLSSLEGIMELSAMSETEMEFYFASVQEPVPEFTVTASLIVKGIVLVLGAMGIFGISIWMLVVEMICYYELFASADPQSGNTYFALGLVGEFVGLSILMPIFVFVVRNKDLGMYPRNAPVYNGQVVYTQQENM